MEEMLKGYILAKEKEVERKEREAMRTEIQEQTKKIQEQDEQIQALATTIVELNMQIQKLHSLTLELSSGLHTQRSHVARQLGDLGDRMPGSGDDGSSKSKPMPSADTGTGRAGSDAHNFAETCATGPATMLTPPL